MSGAPDLTCANLLNGRGKIRPAQGVRVIGGGRRCPIVRQPATATLGN